MKHLYVDTLQRLLVVVAALAPMFASVAPAHAYFTNNMISATVIDGSPTPSVTPGDQSSNLRFTFTPATVTGSVTCIPGTPCMAFTLTFAATSTNQATQDGFYFSSSTISASDIVLEDDLATTFSGNLRVMSVSTVTSYGNFTQPNKLIVWVDATSMSFGSVSQSRVYTITVINNRIVNPTKSAAAGTADVYPVVLQYFVNEVGPDIDVNGAANDNGTASIAVVEATTLSATVNESLTVTVSGLPVEVPVGSGYTNEVQSTATTCPFGTLVPNVARTCVQEITITTTAVSGYVLNLDQLSSQTDGNMVNANGDFIAAFKDGTRVDDGSAVSWVPPSSQLVGGHLGYTAAVIGQGGTTPFSDGTKYAGIPKGPASTDGPTVLGLVASNTSATTGDVIYVGYTIQINALQPAGVYTNDINYVVYTVNT